jgi:hypothetical protein
MKAYNLLVFMSQAKNYGAGLRRGRKDVLLSLRNVETWIIN